MDLDFWQLLLFLTLALVSEIVGTVSGFGSSVLFVPLASLFYDIPTVLGLTASFHVLSNLLKIILFRAKINVAILLKLGIPATLFVILGAILTAYINPKYFEIILAVVLICLAVLLLLSSKIQLKQTNANLILGGVFSGFFAGLVGTGGSIRGITMAAFNLEKEVFILTSAGIDMSVDLSRTIIYFMNGFISSTVWMLLPFLFISSFIGTWIGKKIIEKISQKIFRIIALTTIIFTSIYQIINVL